MHKPITLGTIVAWQCAQAPYVKKERDFQTWSLFWVHKLSKLLDVHLFFFIYSVDKYHMDIGNNKYSVYCNLTNSIKQGT